MEIQQLSYTVPPLKGYTDLQDDHRLIISVTVRWTVEVIVCHMGLEALGIPTYLQRLGIVPTVRSKEVRIIRQLLGIRFYIQFPNQCCKTVMSLWKLCCCNKKYTTTCHLNVISCLGAVLGNASYMYNTSSSNSFLLCYVPAR